MRRRRKHSFNWFRLILIVVAGYFLYVCVGQQLEIQAISRETEFSRLRLEQVQQQHKALTNEKEQLSSSAYIEKLAREELGLVKPGEVPYIQAGKN